VNVLRRIHAALVPGGLLIDTQPVSAHPPVEARSGELGTLDMREWAQTIADIDGLVRTTIRDGLFSVQDERDLVVTDSFDDGAELVTTVRAWRGTQIDAALAKRVAKEQGPAHVHQDVALRVLRAI
jgi:hypothetical protein